jgi:hypothetical protein
MGLCYRYGIPIYLKRFTMKSKGRIVSSGMLSRVALVKTDVLEGLASPSSG